MFFKKKVKLVTHNGTFHVDDIFACATLQMILDGKGQTYTITRTRNPEIIATADYVFDVGGIDDPEKNKFDHHQKGGAGQRANGIPYASFGLVWKKFGKELCGSAEIAERIDKELVQPIDAGDNGVSLMNLTTDVVPVTIESVFYAFRPTWKENTELFDVEFPKRVRFAKELLQRAIIKAKDNAQARMFAERAYDQAVDKRIVVLDGDYPFQEAFEKYPEVLYAVMQKRHSANDWRVVAVRKVPHAFENRKDLPSAWAGKRDEELAEVTGVSDAVFCHNGLFLAVARSQNGAMQLAKLAVDNESTKNN